MRKLSYAYEKTSLGFQYGSEISRNSRIKHCNSNALKAEFCLLVLPQKFVNARDNTIIILMLMRLIIINYYDIIIIIWPIVYNTLFKAGCLYL